MSCIHCLETQPRITNLYRHEGLHQKFTELTGIKIIKNTFICDDCVVFLETSHSFKMKCIENCKPNNLREPSDKDPIGIKEEKIFIPENSNPEYQDGEIIIYEAEYIDDEFSTKSESKELEDDIEIDSDESVEFFSSQNPFSNSRNKRTKRSCYSDEEKLKVIAYAEKTSNRHAAKSFSMNESTIRKWRKDMGINLNQFPPPDKAEEIKDPQPQEKKTPKLHRNSYPASLKVEISKYAMKVGNRGAARKYLVDESCIRKWRQNIDMLEEIDCERKMKRKPNLHWPLLDLELKKWAFAEMESGIRLRPAEIKQKSLEIAKKLNIKNFIGTSSYVFRFMERYKISKRQPSLKS